VRAGKRDLLSSSPWQRGWRRLTRIWGPDTIANVDEELRFHFEQKVAEFEALGLSDAQARARAEEEFGDVQTVRESLTDIDGRLAKRQQRAEWWEGTVQDLRYVARGLRRSPGFTATVIVTLALGLGANAAIFSVLDRLYVQPPSGLPSPFNMRRLYQHTINWNQPYVRSGFAYTEVRAFRQAKLTGVPIAAYSTRKVRNGRNANSAEVGGTFVEGDYFGATGVRMALGRPFDSTEYAITSNAFVAVISHQLWQRQFGGDSSVIGQNIDLASHRHVIVGVAAEKFRGLDLKPVDVWLPLSTMGVTTGRKPGWYESRNFNGLSVVLRVSNDAQAEIINSRATLLLRDPAVRLINDSTSTTSLGSIIDGRGSRLYGKELAISTRLAGVAAVILLIACANVVNLLLARAQHRQREIAVRLALGVSRLRLLSQLMIESSVLALLSALVALAVAWSGATMLRRLLLPDVQWTEGAVNPRVAIFTVVLALFVGVLAGLVPALQASRPNLASAMKSSARDGGQRSARLRTLLLIMQAALSVVLLVGAGVFVRSLRTVERVDTGFDIGRIVYATVSYDRELGNHEKEIAEGLPLAAERVRRIPGVEAVAMAGNIPMYGFSFTDLFLPGRDSLPPAGKMSRILSVVSPEYFKAVGLQVMRGRTFTEADLPGSELVMAMNENMAKNLWPGEDPLTKCVVVGKKDSPCRRVVAIVAPAHFSSIIEEPSMLYYLPLLQAGEEGYAGALIIRTASGRTDGIVPLVQAELRQHFGSWARPWTPTMEELVEPEMRPWRTGAALFTVAGMLALLVAAVGVYSSIAYTISQRTHEMGVRVALGASSSNIMRLVLSEGIRIVSIGVGIGVLASLALGSIVASMLYQTSPRDPFVLVASTATLLLVTVVACSIPAWRASRVDPLKALGAE